MLNKYSLLLGLGVAAASLSSCSRATYSFNNSAPAYAPAEQVRSVAAETTPAEEASVATAAVEAVPQVQATAAHEAATALVQRHAPAAKTVTATESAQATAAPTKLDHATRKALRQELKRQLSKAPADTAASGKSQLVALLLLIFLGGLGIHRFYLGYVGMGILYIALLLTSFLIVPGIALAILLLIDLVRTIIGTLKPKNGEYAKTL